MSSPGCDYVLARLNMAPDSNLPFHVARLPSGSHSRIVLTPAVIITDNPQPAFGLFVAAVRGAIEPCAVAKRAKSIMVPSPSPEPVCAILAILWSISLPGICDVVNLRRIVNPVIETTAIAVDRHFSGSHRRRDDPSE